MSSLKHALASPLCLNTHSNRLCVCFAYIYTLESPLCLICVYIHTRLARMCCAVHSDFVRVFTLSGVHTRVFRLRVVHTRFARVCVDAFYLKSYRVCVCTPGSEFQANC